LRPTTAGDVRKMAKYLSRLEAKKHAVRSGLVNSFAEFDEKYPKSEYVIVWGRYGTPSIRKNCSNCNEQTIAIWRTIQEKPMLEKYWKCSGCWKKYVEDD